MKRRTALAIVAVSAPALAAAAQAPAASRVDAAAAARPAYENTAVQVAPAAPAGPVDAAAAARPVYKNPSAPIAARVNDLLRRMTLQEKIGQMDQIVVGRLRAASDPGNGRLQRRQRPRSRSRAACSACSSTYKVGSILSGGTDNPPDNTGRGWAELYNTVQRYAIEHSRLHIPILYGVDAVHGFGHPTDATLVPHEIGQGASWDPDLARADRRRGPPAAGGRRHDAGTSRPCRTSRATTAGAATTSPGRRTSCWPARMGAANITGMQNARGDQLDVASTVKHFAAYGSSVNGHDRVQAEIPIRYLQDDVPAVLRGRDRRRRGDRHDPGRLDQPHPGVRVAVPADRRSCATGWASRAC